MNLTMETSIFWTGRNRGTLENFWKHGTQTNRESNKKLTDRIYQLMKKRSTNYMKKVKLTKTF